MPRIIHFIVLIAYPYNISLLSGFCQLRKQLIFATLIRYKTHLQNRTEINTLMFSVHIQHIQLFSLHSTCIFSSSRYLKPSKSSLLKAYASKFEPHFNNQVLYYDPSKILYILAENLRISFLGISAPFCGQGPKIQNLTEYIRKRKYENLTFH
jgi:hypothetical protein